MAKTKIPPALGICDKCLLNAKQNGKIIRTYCRHNNAGAAMIVGHGNYWHIFSPISEYDFVGATDIAAASQENSKSLQH